MSSFAGQYLIRSKEVRVWLLMGLNLTVKLLTSPGGRCRLWTNGRVGPSVKPPLVLVREL